MPRQRKRRRKNKQKEIHILERMDVEEGDSCCNADFECSCGFAGCIMLPDDTIHLDSAITQELVPESIKIK